MREIHFFENESDEYEWVAHQNIEGRPIWIANDFAKMKYVESHLSEINEDVATTQMSYLNTRWFEEGFRIFVHDHTGTFEIVLGEGNERTDRAIRYGHSLYRLWVNGEFGLKEEEESFEDFMKRYREECGEPLLVDENGNVVENRYKTKRRK